MSRCDSCTHNYYDEEAEGYYCDVNFDEDELAVMNYHGNKECPYYSSDDEYGLVRHQI